MPSSKNPLKILVLKNNAGELSKTLQSTIDDLEASNEIQIINELADTGNEEQVKQFAQEIILNNYDIVFVDEKVKSSAWGIIRHSHIQAEQKSSSAPRFYLDGKAENILKREFENSQFSGAVRIDQINELKNSKTLFSGAYGQANQATHQTISNNLDTKFCIGSITKMFTALAVLIMAEKFQLDLKTPIKILLKKKDVEYPYENIFDDFTLHELLTHTSGFPPGIEDRFFKTKMISFEHLAQYLPWIESLHQDKNIADRHHQKQFQYSNGGMFLLGFAIEAITGKDYYIFLQENIFQPVGMTNTTSRRISGDSSYSIPYTTCSPLPSPTEIEWLNALLFDDNNPIHKFSKNANQWLEYAKNYNQQNVERIQKLTDEYQTLLAKTQDENAFPALRIKLAELIQQTSEHFEKYEQDILKFHRDVQQLQQWIDENKKKPGFDDAIKLHSAIFQKIENNLHWPFKTLEALTINLSLAHPAGKFFSTVEDMTTFQKALWCIDGKLSKYASQLVKETVPIDTFGNRYGYGIEVRKEGKTVGHTGVVAGGSASCFTYRDSGYTVVALSNSDQITLEIAAEIERNFVYGTEHDVIYLDPAINPEAYETLAQEFQGGFSFR